MTVTLEEAKSRLGDLVTKAAAGEPIIITSGDKPVAQLVPAAPGRPKPHYGSCQGKLIILSEDDEHLKDFQEYMP